MHKRMRRGKEMYPSFDTRRVLCKQHRPYCVKPLRARLKSSNASNAASILRGLKTGPTGLGRLRSIALRPVPTKTQDEGQSIAAWSAMSRLALVLMSRPDWRVRTRGVFQRGARTTGLKRLLRHHLDGYHWKSAPRGRKKRLFCGSRRHGLSTGLLHLGQSIRWRFDMRLDRLITETTNKANSDPGCMHANNGKSEKATFTGARIEKPWELNTERSTKTSSQKQERGGCKTTQKNGWSANVGNDAIPSFVPCETFAKGYGRHCEASAVAHQLLAAPA